MSLLRLLAWIVLRVDVGNAPRPGALELDHRVLLGEVIVGHTGREREQAARGQNLRLGAISRFTHAQANRSRNHGDNLWLGVGVWGDVIVLWRLQPKDKHAFLARV